MNKKGFTLVELLAVITLIAILSGIAVANVISSINNSKKNTFLLDAKRMVSRAEYLISENSEDRNLVKTTTSGVIYSYATLNDKGEFQTDSDGGVFDSNSFVKVTREGSVIMYCVCVIGSKRLISSGNTCNATTGAGCIDSSELSSISIVKDKWM